MIGPGKKAGLFALAGLLLALTGCASNQAAADEVYRGGLARSSGDTQGAIKIFEDGLAAYPDHTRMRFALARLQLDTGENEHLAERSAALQGKKLQEEGKSAEAQGFSREAQDHHAKASPFYTRARDHLRIVAEKDDDQVRQAWAFVLLVKCDVFFEDYPRAQDDLQKAIDRGNLPQQKLAEWKDYLKALQAETNGKKPKS